MITFYEFLNTSTIGPGAMIPADSIGNQAADVLIDVMGGGTKVYLEKRHEAFHAWSTWQKSVDILNYSDNTSLKQGLSQMWEWAKKQPDRGQFKWDKYEVEKGIYSYWK